MDTHFIDIMRVPHEHDAQALVAQLQQKVFALCGVTFDHPPKGKAFEYYNVTLCNAVGSEYAGAELFAQDSNAAAFFIRIHVTYLSCHLICNAMRLKGYTQLPEYVSTSTSYSHKDYRCRIRWNDALTKNGGFFDGPHYDSDHHNAFRWCSRCAKTGCYWENTDCVARVNESTNSPGWQEVADKKKRDNEAALQRAAKRQQKERMKKLGMAAARAFSRK